MVASVAPAASMAANAASWSSSSSTPYTSCPKCVRIIASVGAIFARHSVTVRPRAAMRSVMVPSCTVIPTKGSRPRRIRSGSIASTALSPAPKHLIRRNTSVLASGCIARRACFTVCSHITRISEGTPGNANALQVSPPTLAISISMPGAVPSGFGMIRLAFGNMACRQFVWGIGMTRAANRASTAARAASESSSGKSTVSESTSRVRSSAVGPSPPVDRITSAREAAIRKAATPSSRESVTVV